MIDIETYRRRIGRYLPKCGQSTKGEEADISKQFAVTAILLLAVCI